MCSDKNIILHVVGSHPNVSPCFLLLLKKIMHKKSMWFKRDGQKIDKKVEGKKIFITLLKYKHDYFLLLLCAF